MRSRHRSSIMALLVCVEFAWCAGCRARSIGWPPGAGYLSGQAKRPQSPLDVKPCKTRAEIEAVQGDSMQTSADSRVEYRGSKELFVHPGAELTYLASSPDHYALPDYNGDECTVCRGLTVRVDEYGQFVPIRYAPKP